MFTKHISNIYMYKEDLVLNNQQCPKSQPNQTNSEECIDPKFTDKSEVTQWV